MTLLDDERNLNCFKGNIFLEAAPFLLNIKAFADLFGGHNGAAVLIANVLATLLLGGGACTLDITLAMLVLKS